MEIIHRPEESRFTAEIEGHTAQLQYTQTDSSIHITHTLVPPPLEGRGIAGALNRAALLWAKDAGLKAVPVCSYTAAFVRRHPELL